MTFDRRHPWPAALVACAALGCTSLATNTGAAGEAGGPLWSQDVYRALQRDLTACGIVSHRVHDLRHTLASLCADAGMEENVAARWTHAPTGQSSRHLYALPSWERQCTEMLKLLLKPKKYW